jgi:hypothetical protein
LFGDDVLIVVINVVLFFQGKDFIIGLWNGWLCVGCGCQKLLVVVAFLPFAAGSMSDNSGCVAGCFDHLGCFSSCNLVGGCGHGSCSNRSLSWALLAFAPLGL